jgi:hypothetical protein
MSEDQKHEDAESPVAPAHSPQEVHASGHAEKSVSKKHGPPKGFIGRMIDVWWEATLNVFRGRKDPDKKTRVVTYFFFFFFLLSFLLAGANLYYWIKIKPSLKAGHGVSEPGNQKGKGEPKRDAHGNIIDDGVEVSKKGLPTFSLGKFTIEIKVKKGAAPIRGALNVVDITIEIECDVKETCAWIKDNLIPVRSEITSVFVPQDREEIMTREGKRRLLREVLEKINHVIPKGKVENIYVTRMIVS